MKHQIAVAILSLFIVVGCRQTPNTIEKQVQESSQGNVDYSVQAKDDSLIYYGELIYIPVYSSIYFESEKKSIDLSATLSIHNTDPEKSIILSKVNYHNTKGQLLKIFLNERITLLPFETINYVIDEKDRSGGIGANFIVEWMCDRPVSNPVTEAIMITTQMNQGISFTTQGKVIRKFGSAIVSNRN